MYSVKQTNPTTPSKNLSVSLNEIDVLQTLTPKARLASQFPPIFDINEQLFTVVSNKRFKLREYMRHSSSFKKNISDVYNKIEKKKRSIAVRLASDTKKKCIRVLFPEVLRPQCSSTPDLVNELLSPQSSNSPSSIRRVFESLDSHFWRNLHAYKIRSTLSRITDMFKKSNKIKCDVCSKLTLVCDCVSEIISNPSSPTVLALRKEFDDLIFKIDDLHPQMFKSLIPSLPELNINCDDSIKILMQNLITSMSDIGSKISSGIDVKVEHTFPSITEALSSFGTTDISCCESILVFSVVALSLYSWYNDSPLADLLIIAITCYISINFPDSFAISSGLFGILSSAKVGKLASRCVTGILEPQSDISDARPITLAVLGYVYFCAYKASPTEDFLESFLKKISNVSKTFSSIEFTFDYILTVAQKFCTFIADSTGTKPMMEVCPLFPDLEDCSRELENLIADFKKGSCYNYDNSIKVFNLEQRIARVIAALPTGREYAHHHKRALLLSSSIKPIVSKMERNNLVNNGPRREPLGIMIGGPSGVGKSTMLIPLIAQICARVMPEDQFDSFERNHDDHIWNFIPENPFHDSYHGQFNVIHDEAGSKRDSIGCSDDGALAAMRMINSMSFPLHMANLEDKGNVNFRSELVWATTNRNFFDWKSMYLSEAYTRRFTQSYVHVPKKEFSLPFVGDQKDIWKRRLDTKKCNIIWTDGEADFDLTVNEFYRWDFANGVALSETPLSYDELITEISDAYLKKRAQGNALLSFHQRSKSTGKEARNAYRLSRSHLLASHDKEILRPQSGEESDELIDTNRWLKFNSLSPFKGMEVATSYAHLHELWKRSMEPTFSAVSPAIEFGKKLISNPYIASLGSILLQFGIAWSFAKVILKFQSGDVKKTLTQVKALRKVRGAKRFNRINKVVLEPQSGIVISKNLNDLCTKIYKKSVYNIKIAGSNTKFGYLTFLTGRLGVMPLHYFDRFNELWEEDPEVELEISRASTPGAGFRVKYKDLDFAESDESDGDSIFVKFPNVLPQQADITKFFPRNDNKLLYSKFAGAMMRDNGSGYNLHSTIVQPCGSYTYSLYEVQKGFSYNIATLDGECGLPIFMADSRCSTPFVVGQHVAGSGTTGRAAPICRDDIDAAIVAFGIVRGTELDDEVLVEQCNLPSQFLPVGVRPPVHSNANSQVIPSLLHNSWSTSDYKPAMLKPTVVDGIRIDPLFIARSKYCNMYSALDVDLLTNCTNSYANVIIKSSINNDPWDPRVFTREESIQGIPGVGFKGIPRNSSPGYPYSIGRSKPGKVDFFGNEETYSYSSNSCIDLFSNLDDHIDKLKVGVRPQFIYMDFLKDERRTSKKVLTGSTRLVSASPLDHLILCRMYFGDFVRWMVQNRIKNGVAIGVNPYGVEWKNMTDHLKFPLAMFGDYSKYDGSISPLLSYEVLKVIEIFYSNSSLEERTIRATLFEDIVNSVHIAIERGVTDVNSSVLYEWFGGNPSGNFLTTIINSVVNCIIIRYNMCIGHSRHTDIDPMDVDMDFIEKNSRMITFGDDNGICVSEELKHIDQSTLTDIFSEMGFTYTDEFKSGGVHTHRSLSDCSFLKRGFFKLGSTVLAPLELGVILESPYWTRSNSKGDESVENTLDTCLLELSLHGRDIFDRYSEPMIRASVLKLEHYPLVLTYKECLKKIQQCEAAY